MGTPGELLAKAKLPKLFERSSVVDWRREPGYEGMLSPGDGISATVVCWWDCPFGVAKGSCQSSGVTTNVSCAYSGSWSAVEELWLDSCSSTSLSNPKSNELSWRVIGEG